MDRGRDSPGGPSCTRSCLRLLAGLFYLTLVALFFCSMTETAFLPVFVAVACGACFSTALGVWWLTRWALRDDSRPGQFGLASLLLLLTVAAVYFALVRMVVIRFVSLGSSRPDEASWAFLMVAVFCLFFALLGVPFLLAMADSLVWFAVWLVRRPAVRRWLNERRPPPEGQ